MILFSSSSVLLKVVFISIHEFYWFIFSPILSSTPLGEGANYCMVLSYCWVEPQQKIVDFCL